MMRNNTIFRLTKTLRTYYPGQGYYKSMVPQLVQKKTLTETNAYALQLNSEKQKFEDAWQDIIYSVKINKKLSQEPEICAWIQEVLNYNTSGNHKMRGLTSVLTYKSLETPENITEEKMKYVRVSGWIMEIMQGYVLILDDIMDGSTTRRGKPCWYRQPNVGLGAVNDCTLILCVTNDIVKTYFGNTKYYSSIMDMMCENLLYISMGQHSDLATSNKHENDYSLFTVKHYEYMVVNKTYYCGFKLPIFFALLFIENKDRIPHKQIENICFDMARLFQMQNDMMDCFGDPAITGKEGTDIQERKCNWLSAHALERCDSEQRKVFEKHFGSPKPEYVSRIKMLYQELNLIELFKEEENIIYESIVRQIQALPSDISPAMFYTQFEIYKEKSTTLKSV